MNIKMKLRIFTFKDTNKSIALKKNIALFFITLFALNYHLLNATHIVGGVINYSYKSSEIYTITLKVYRDCSNDQNALFDDTAFVSVFEGTSSYKYTLGLRSPQIIVLPLNKPDPCVGLPKGVCVEEATYVSDIKLPINTQGYTLMYQRCCRNSTIKNIIDPLTVGTTYSMFIPAPNVVAVNSSPVFTSLPPVFLCNQLNFSYDHSAKDSDGDSLAYKMCSPSIGANATDSKPFFADPILIDVPWATDYNPSSPLAPGSNIKLDPKTGLLTGKPTATGQYVVGICVEEYRNGKFIGSTKRDFQFNVVNCPPAPTAVLPSKMQNCGLDVNFLPESLNATTFRWDFGVTGIISDTSREQFPTYVYPDSGKYLVTLIINNNTICADTAKGIFRVHRTLDGADFLAKDTCVFTNVIASDKSILNFGTIKKRYWSLSSSNIKINDTPTASFNTQLSGTSTIQLIVENEFGCQDTAQKPVQIYPLPTVKIIGDPFICLNESKNYTVQGNYASLKWRASPNISCTTCSNVSIQGKNSAKYKVTATSSNHCINSDSISILVPLVKAQTTPNSLICYDNDFQINSSGGQNYLWIPSTNLSCSNCPNPIVRLKNNQNYKLVVSDKNSCKDTTTINFTLRPKIIFTIVKPDSICYGTDANINANIPSSTSIRWNPINKVNCNTCANTKTSTLYENQKYIATVTDANNCTQTDSIQVYIYPRAIDLGANKDICYGDTVKLNTKNVTVKSWTPSNLCQTCTSQNVIPKDTTLYVANVLDRHMCTYSDSIKINVRRIFPHFDFSVNHGRCVNYPINLKASVSNIDSVCYSKIHYLWDLDEGKTDTTSSLQYFYTFEGNKTIKLKLKNVPDSVSKTIYVLKEDSCLKNIYIPNTFTPNGDGENDILFVRGTNIINLKFYIYNNLGERVFESESLHNGWDGIFRGDKQKSQVFVYYCDAQFWDGSTVHKEGNITLLE